MILTPVEGLSIGLAGGCLLTLASQWSNTMTRRLESLKDIQQGLEQILTKPVPAAESAPEPEPEEAALPVDPDNPPFPRVYRRRPGREPRFCHCHGRELVDGETVLFWPNPDIEGAFWLVCAPEGMTA
jgi:hypothetical protein